MIIRKWKNASAVVTGKDHLTDNSLCQDKTAYVRQNNVHVIALSDGAGSKPKSGEGAEIAVNTVCSLFIKNFDDIFMSLEPAVANGAKSVADLIISRIVDTIVAVKTDGEEMSDYASTLLFVALKNNKYVIGHIGDGVIGGLFSGKSGDELRILSAPENGGAPNLTFFITENESEKHLRLYSGEFQNLKGLILMSDGPEESLFHDGRLHANTKKLFDNFRGIPEQQYCGVLADFLKFKAANYSDDDLSLNILFLEDSNAKTVNDSYKNYLFSDIVSKKQIVSLSPYCMFLDNSFAPKIHDDINEIRRCV